MKLKKFLAGIGALLLCSLLFLPIEGQAAEQSENVMPITTKVPDAHTVLLDVGKHGFVLINGKTYTHENKEAEIGRLARQEYIIQADKGWQTESVRYGKAGAQETVKLTDNAFTVPAINSDDNQLTVTFKKAPAGGGSGTGNTKTGKGGIISTGTQTGDTTNIAGMGTLLLLSMTAIILLAGKKKAEI